MALLWQKWLWWGRVMMTYLPSLICLDSFQGISSKLWDSTQHVLKVIGCKDNIDIIVSSIANSLIKVFDIAVLGMQKFSSLHICSTRIGPQLEGSYFLTLYSVPLIYVYLDANITLFDAIRSGVVFLNSFLHQSLLVYRNKTDIVC